MDIGRNFLTKLVDEGKLNEVRREGIDREFLDEDLVPVWNYIIRYYSEHKATPTRDVISNAYPNFDFPEVSEPLSYYIGELKESYRRTTLEEHLNDIAKYYFKDTQRAEAELRRTLILLSVASKTHKDVDLAETAPDRYVSYLRREENPGADGILSNWPSVDYETLGWHSEELGVLVGEKFIGKSWILLWLAYQAVRQGERVLFITPEMSTEAVARRFDSIYSQIQYDSLRRGELSEQEKKRYKESMEQFRDSNHRFVVARQGIDSVQDIEIKAVEHDSTIVFGDSIYLYPSEPGEGQLKEVEKLRRVSHKCKEIATSLAVPFWVSVQAGRKKTKKREIDLDQIEWSNAFAQDADNVIFIHKDEVDKELNRAQAHLIKVRDGGNEASIYLNTNYNYMTFEQSKEKFRPTTNIEFDEETVDLR